MVYAFKKQDLSKPLLCYERFDSMKYILALTASIVLTACSGAPSGSIVSAENVQQATAQGDNAPFIYKLGAGDKVRVTVYQEDDLSGKFEIDSKGMISLPYVQEVQAAGLSAKELSDNIAKTFIEKGILKDPKISIEVLNYRPFYIQGEVNKGGEYPYKANMDIRNAVATAGGYTYRADDGTAYIRREGNSSILKVDIGKGKFPVYPGDNIEIPERFF